MEEGASVALQSSWSFLRSAEKDVAFWGKSREPSISPGPLRAWCFAGPRLIGRFCACCSREDRYADGVAVDSFLEKRY